MFYRKYVMLYNVAYVAYFLYWLYACVRQMHVVVTRMMQSIDRHTSLD